jgi:prepilin-type N-terminal cleavage/methylation domain-containing protein
MNPVPKINFGPRRLPVQWLEQPPMGPLAMVRGKIRREVPTPPCAFRPLPRGASGFFGRNLRAFTLLELMLVIAIIGFIAALALPMVTGFGKANAMTSATRQLLDDVALARQRAMVNRSTVYMVFLPPMFWTNYFFLNPTSGYQMVGSQVTNLVTHQYAAYALVSLASVGDQPGQHHARYVTDWRFLPNGVFIAPFEFTLTNIYPPMNVTTTNTLTGVTNVSVVSAWNTVTVPFPSLYLPNTVMPLPCIGFTAQGSLTTPYTNQYIALARGSIFYPTDTNGVPLEQQAMLSENPPGNDTNNPNLIQIDWMTARATLLQNQFQ